MVTTSVKQCGKRSEIGSRHWNKDSDRDRKIVRECEPMARIKCSGHLGNDDVYQM